MANWSPFNDPPPTRAMTDRRRPSWHRKSAGSHVAAAVTLLAAISLPSCGADTFTVGYLTNIHGRENPTRSGLVISGAISYAIDLINHDSTMMEGHQLRMIYTDTEGDTLIGTNATIQQWREGAIAIFGPEDSCEVEATVASSLNLPMMSYKCADSRSSQKEYYRTFARTYPPSKGVVRSILVLLQYYRWRKFSIISEQNNPYVTVAKSLEQQAIGHNFTINQRGVRFFKNPHVCCEDKKPCCEDIFRRLVEDTYLSTRVYVFLGKTADLIQMLMMMQLRKLLDSNEYVVIYVDLEAYWESTSYRYFWRMDMREGEKQVAQRAARSLLVIVPSPPHDRGYAHFEKKVREYNRRPPFEFPNQLLFVKHITEYAAYLYDSVMLYADALGTALREDRDPRNGTYIIQKIISKGRYRSVTGAWMQIDENGDVEGNYTVLCLQPAPHNLTLKGMPGSDEYEYLAPHRVAVSANLSHLMLPIGNFQFDEHSRKTVFNPLDISLDWVAPLEEPPCGFDVSGCKAPSDPIREIAASILCIAFLGSCLTSWVCYKNWKYEQEIAGLLWKIPIEDIQTFGPGGVVSSPSKLSVSSQMSLESKVTGQVFTQTALYKGTVVATKALKFSRKNIEIQRETKKEMMIMREMHHDNINQFIGACVHPNSIFIVTEYCARGSLQDILENDDIKLDQTFIASLVFDLLKAMIFLHESDLKVHGNLKSSNCVVTSRWVLQVTDYGLQDLHRAASADTAIDYEYYRKLLWKAPEVLRRLPDYVRGSPKADVYSFGIILHEIMLRMGPFGNCDLQPDEILARVKAGPDESTAESFRPPLVEFIGQDYIRLTMLECWAERPESRPSFRQIRVKLLKMKQGMKSNIMDNMMAMMEQYANNLEELVDERTAQLLEEQKKTEALLHRMLPKSVAEQLMLGEAVSPESFDAVTIYFSDIVGFTEMSAFSTPMEVVTFLNDLYTVFDSIIGHYDVYKVETIGDAYMVVSGLPLRNGHRHAGQIASMALELLDAVRSFRIRHRPGQALRLRIGIHTGPVVAGVVGLTMPRYCLFGDTVNTASRMESNGEALKIHISDQCKQILEQLGGYETLSRGLVKMKGKGELETHWLTGHHDSNRDGKTHAREVVPPVPLFPLRDTEARRRSPKVDCTRRGSMVPPWSVEDAPLHPNGSIPGIPVFLRLSQDSPRVGKRFGGWPQPARANKELSEELAQEAVNGNCDATTEEQPWIQVPRTPDSTVVDVHARMSDGTEENGNYGRQLSVGGRRHCSGGDGRNAPATERKKNPFVAFDDTTKPLLCSRDRKAEVLSAADRHHQRLRITPIPNQSSKRWRSCDEIEEPKASLKDWLAGLFNSRQPDTEALRRSGNMSGALLRPVKEMDKEESVV